MQQLDDYTPTIPDSVTAHYLARSGTIIFVIKVGVVCNRLSRKVAYVYFSLSENGC